MKAANTPARVVVTGIGVVSPIGIGIDTFWSSLLAGRSGIGRLKAIPNENLPSKLAAEVRDFDPASHVRRSISPEEPSLRLG